MFLSLRAALLLTPRSRLPAASALRARWRGPAGSAGAREIRAASGERGETPRSGGGASQTGGPRCPAGSVSCPNERGLYPHLPLPRLHRAQKETAFPLAPTTEAEAVADLKIVRSASPPRSVRFPQVAPGAVIAPRLPAASPGGAASAPHKTFPRALGPGAPTGKVRFLESTRKD